jgi:hypothetical protein
MELSRKHPTGLFSLNLPTATQSAHCKHALAAFFNISADQHSSSHRDKLTSIMSKQTVLIVYLLFLLPAIATRGNWTSYSPDTPPSGRVRPEWVEDYEAKFGKDALGNRWKTMKLPPWSPMLTDPVYQNTRSNTGYDDRPMTDYTPYVGETQTNKEQLVSDLKKKFPGIHTVKTPQNHIPPWDMANRYLDVAERDDPFEQLYGPRPYDRGPGPLDPGYDLETLYSLDIAWDKHPLSRTTQTSIEITITTIITITAAADDGGEASDTATPTTPTTNTIISVDGGKERGMADADEEHREQYRRRDWYQVQQTPTATITTTGSIDWTTPIPSGLGPKAYEDYWESKWTATKRMQVSKERQEKAARKSAVSKSKAIEVALQSAAKAEHEWQEAADEAMEAKEEKMEADEEARKAYDHYISVGKDVNKEIDSLLLPVMTTTACLMNETAKVVSLWTERVITPS